MADDTKATPPAAPAEPPASAPAATDPPSDELRMPKSAFEARLEQAKRAERLAFLKAHGFESEEAFKDFKKATDAARKADEEKRKAEMSELERYKAEIAERDQRIAAAEAAKVEAEQRAEEARIEAHLNRLFSERGIKDAEYALTLLEKHAAALPEGQEDFDEAAVLDEMLKDPRRRYALGVDSEPPSVSTPASTTAPKNGPTPPNPQPKDPKKKFHEMTPEEYRAWEKDPNALP